MKDKKSFTLIELIVVIAIIAVLAAIIAPNEIINKKKNEFLAFLYLSVVFWKFSSHKS